MSFNPLEDQNYYLIVKHTQKAVGFENGTNGSGLKQQAFVPDNNLQKFYFRRALNEDFFRITTAGDRNKYLTVDGGRQDNLAAIILWEAGDHNKFKLIPAKDGYYRIEVVHSKKFLEVYGLSTLDGENVVQHSLSKTDNQLFKILPVFNDIVGDDTTSYSTNNDMVRTIAIGVVSGGMGYVAGPLGGLSKGALDYVWKQDDQLADMWNKMKVHMDQRMRALIDDVLTDGLKDIIDGVLKAVKYINDTDEPRGKGDALASQLQIMVNKEPVFFNSKSKKAIPYTIVYGTLAIALKHLMLAEYRRLYIYNPPPSFETLSDKAKQLTNSIIEYTKAIDDFKAKSLKKRLSCIRAEEKPEDVPADVTYSIYRDDYDSWTPAYSTSDDLLLHKDFYDFAIQQRKKYIGTRYAMELDELLSIVNLWKCYIPKKAKDLDGAATAASKAAKDRIEKTFAETSSQDPLQLLTILIKDVAATIDNKDIKRDITDAGSDILSRARLMEADEVKKAFVKSVETIYKNIEFAKAYQDGYQEVLDLHAAAKSRKEVTVGIFGGNKATKTFDNTGKITKIVLYYGIFGICTGIEVFYDGASTGICGVGGKAKKELKLEENEYVSSVSGYMNEIISGICFETQLGNSVDTSIVLNNHRSRYFIADLPDTLNARLIGISGAHDGISIQQLSFKWEYDYVDYSKLIR